MSTIKLLTTCVDYADHLSRALPTWLVPGVEVLVVTSLNNPDTEYICDAYGVGCHKTGAFHADGAKFNKPRGMLDAIAATGWLDPPGWRLFIDADICLPEGWLQAVLESRPQIGNLYGIQRRPENEEAVPSRHGIVGYWHMFHSADERVRDNGPLLLTRWGHAGGYDMVFRRRWRPRRRVWLPLTAVHLGESNWFGRRRRQPGPTKLRKVAKKYRKRVGE